MDLVEGWEYNRLMNLYKRELKHIDDDIVLGEDEKRRQKAIVNEQIKQLKLALKKKDKKPKYDRAKAEEETERLIKKFEEGEK